MTPQSTPTPAKPRKRTRLFIIAITLTIVIGAAVIMSAVLRLVTSEDRELANVAPSARGIFNAYIEKGVDVIFDTGHYVRTPSSETSVYFKGANHAYAVATPTSLVSIYQAQSSATGSDDIYDKTKRFLKKLSLTDTQSFAEPADSERYYAFQNNEAYCQLTSYKDYSGESEQVPTYRFACIEKSDTDTVYKHTQQLLALYASDQSSAIERLSINSEKMDGEDISYDLLFVSSGKETKILLFASVHGTEEYIGDLSPHGEAFSKYTVTADVREKLNDPKYKGFLVERIIGSDAG